MASKRTIDDMLRPVEVPSVVLKRAISEGEGAGADDGDVSGKSFLLASQNRSLNRELMRSKRSITEARRELELMRRKSREMESLVSLIQRAWSQLDIDTSMLLDSLGDSEAKVSDEGSSELLHRLVSAGSRFLKIDPTQVDSVPHVSADQWHSREDVEKQRLQIQAELKERETEREQRSNRSESLTDEDLNEVYGGSVDENLAAHVSFTLSLLERLCNAINDSGGAALQADAVNAINEMRELRGEKLVLSDRITKLTSEIVDLSAKLRLAEADRWRAERELDRTILAAKESATVPKPASSAGTVAGEGVGVEGGADSAGAAVAAAVPSNPSLEKELRKQIAIMERQLSESESSKAQVEMTLTERLARPLPQTEVHVADMRNAMEELRQQSKQRVAALIAENDQLQDKVRNLELALSHLEAISAARIEEVVTLAQKEVAVHKAEKDAAQAAMCTLRTDLALTEQMKTQLAEYQGLEELRAGEVQKLQERVRALSEHQQLLQSSLDGSRAREDELQRLIATRTSSEVEPVGGAGSGGGDAQSVSELKRLLQQAQERIADMQKELQNSSNNINDLIMEIEAVSSEEAKARAQAARLQKQIAESQTLQRVALEENLHLHNQIEDVRASHKEVEGRMELMKAVMVQQEGVITSLRNAEQTVRNECQGAKKNSMQMMGTRHVEEQKLLEARQQLADSEHGVKSAHRRNQELLARCDDLSRQCEVERKTKMELQREIAKLKGAKKDKSASSAGSSSNAGGSGRAGMNPEDADMLEMTLGMLRCSVCKDRFKSCAITRCFHLFCKECIDENLRNRSRKCPACGEKFGQDDVTPVYFN